MGVESVLLEVVKSHLENMTPKYKIAYFALVRYTVSRLEVAQQLMQHAVSIDEV